MHVPCHCIIVLCQEKFKIQDVDNYVEIGDFLKKEDVIYFLQEKCQKKFAMKLSKIRVINANYRCKLCKR